MHRIKIHQGKIAGLHVDAVVSPRSAANDGVEPSAENDLLAALSIGDVQLIRGSEATVIEAIAPRWRGGDCDEDQQLASCYRNAMSVAKQQNFRSIAFTPISYGPFGFPANRSTKIAIQQITLALRLNPFIESVTFCCFDPVTTALYRNHIGK